MEVIDCKGSFDELPCLRKFDGCHRPYLKAPTQPTLPDKRPPSFNEIWEWHAKPLSIGNLISLPERCKLFAT